MKIVTFNLPIDGEIECIVTRKITENVDGNLVLNERKVESCINTLKLTFTSD